MNRLIAYIDQTLPKINRSLERLLPHEELQPTTLHEAMRYSILGSGKRIRPILCLMAAKACGMEEESIIPAACSLEMLHGYSLIHDDLPSMDNDDMRRGKLATHKAFGEAIAILAGDALLTMAFEILSDKSQPDKAAKAVTTLAKAAGSLGMVGGQVIDLESEGKDAQEDLVEKIHLMKTAALIGASCKIGGILAGATEEQIEALETYGEKLGLVFQITDDILDIESSSEELGKTAGKDIEQKKQTYPAVFGLDKSRHQAKKLITEAKSAISDFEKEALMLRLLPDYLLDRKK